MDTRTTIVDTADQLIRKKGYNAFSFHDIARVVGIKTASVHYHFPTKTELGLGVLSGQLEAVEALKKSTAGRSAGVRLKAFLSIYTQARTENKICVVGSLGSDFNTLEEPIRRALKKLTAVILAWVTDILEEGRRKKEFHFEGAPRTKALMIVTNMLAALQLTRLTGARDFALIKQTILKDLTK
jgi:AcrR family transcriptional regulator